MHAIERGRLGRADVGADVVDQVEPQAEQAAVGGERRLDLGRALGGHRAGEQVLVAILRPAHGHAEAARGDRHQHDRVQDGGLGAERAAALGRRDQAQLGARDAERRSRDAVQRERPLEVGPGGHATGLPVRDHAVALDRRGRASAGAGSARARRARPARRRPRGRRRRTRGRWRRWSRAPRAARARPRPARPRRSPPPAAARSRRARARRRPRRGSGRARPRRRRARRRSARRRPRPRGGRRPAPSAEANGRECAATSAPVTTPITPGSASAAEASMAPMRAWAKGERTIAAQAVLGSGSRSSMNQPWPRSRASSSTRRAERPT